MTTIWATDTTFPSGTYAGQNTKTAPSAGLIATGMNPGERFGAQQFNWLMNYLTTEVGYIRNAQYAHWSITDPSSTPTLNAVTFGIGGLDGTQVAVGNAGVIYYAYRGNTWTTATAGSAYAGNFQGVTNNGTAFCAVGATGGIQTDADGTGTWTARTAASAFAGTFYAVAANSASSGTQPDFVAVGTTGTIQTSTDNGATWATNTAGSAYASTFTSVAYDSVTATWCAVGASGEIQTAPNGNAPLTWTQRRTGTETVGYVCARPGGGFVVAFNNGSGASTIVKSTDGTTFSTVTQVTAAANPSAICVGPDSARVVILGNDGTYDCDYTTLDTWTQRWVNDTSGSHALLGIASSARCMIAVGVDWIATSLRVA